MVVQYCGCSALRLRDRERAFTGTNLDCFAQKQAARETRAGWLRTYSRRRRRVKENRGKNRPESKDLAGKGRIASGEWRIKAGYLLATPYSPLAPNETKGFPGRCPPVPQGQGLTWLK